MGCFSAGAAIGGAVGAIGSGGNAGVAAGASLEAVELSTRVSRELHEHWKAYYAQCDAATISEVCAIPVYVAPSATIAGRQRLEVIRTVGRKRQMLYRGQNVYHVGKMAQDCNVLAGIEATAALDASEWGYRRGQNLEIQRNQRRLENIYAYLGLGRNLLSNALGAASIAGAIASQLGAEAGKSLAGWSQFLGYLNTKEGKAFTEGVFGGVRRIFEGPTPSSAPGTNEAVDLAFGSGTGTAPTTGVQPSGGGNSDSTPNASPSTPSAPGAYGDQGSTPASTQPDGITSGGQTLNP